LDHLGAGSLFQKELSPRIQWQSLSWGHNVGLSKVSKLLEVGHHLHHFRRQFVQFGIVVRVQQVDFGCDLGDQRHIDKVILRSEVLGNQSQFASVILFLIVKDTSNHSSSVFNIKSSRYEFSSIGKVHSNLPSISLGAKMEAKFWK